jgi:hypothetical protein
MGMVRTMKLPGGIDPDDFLDYGSEDLPFIVETVESIKFRFQDGESSESIQDSMFNIGYTKEEIDICVQEFLSRQSDTN